MTGDPSGVASSRLTQYRLTTSVPRDRVRRARSLALGGQHNMSRLRRRPPPSVLGRREILRLGARVGAAGAFVSVPLLLRRGTYPAHASVGTALPQTTAEAVTTPASRSAVPLSPLLTTATEPAPAAPFEAMPKATPPSPPVQAQQHPVWDASGRAIVHVSTTRPLVALTVDDGWSRRTEIMQLLLDQQVPAVFFLTAQAVARDEAFLRTAVREGFEIGNHTTTHHNLSALSRTDVESELSGMDRLFEHAVGSQPPMRFFRAPYGALSKNVLDAADARAYRAIQWDVSTRDWTNLDTEGIARSVVSAARPGSIVLSHFNVRCLNALPRLIAGVRANGLEFVPLSTLIADVAILPEAGAKRTTGIR